MVLALDVHYRSTVAKAVGLCFNWEDEAAEQFIIKYIDAFEKYMPGEFYKRELPCLLTVLSYTDVRHFEALIVDGHIYTDNLFSWGLGAHLYNALNKQVPVIGVAKTAFTSNSETVVRVLRGASNKPLYISAIGVTKEYAAGKISKMSGSYRVPQLLKALDRETKTA